MPRPPSGGSAGPPGPQRDPLHQEDLARPVPGVGPDPGGAPPAEFRMGRVDKLPFKPDQVALARPHQRAPHLLVCRDQMDVRGLRLRRLRVKMLPGPDPPIGEPAELPDPELVHLPRDRHQAPAEREIEGREILARVREGPALDVAGQDQRLRLEPGDRLQQIPVMGDRLRPGQVRLNGHTGRERPVRRDAGPDYQVRPAVRQKVNRAGPDRHERAEGEEGQEEELPGADRDHRSKRAGSPVPSM